MKKHCKFTIFYAHCIFCIYSFFVFVSWSIFFILQFVLNKLNFYQTILFIGSFLDWLIDLFIDASIDWLVDWSMIVWLVDWFIDLLIDW